MNLKLSKLAALVGGEVIGDGEIEVSQALPLQDAVSGCITFVDHPKYLARVSACAASVVMVAEEMNHLSKPMLVVANLHEAFQKTIEILRPPQTISTPTGVHASAMIAGSARVGKGTAIAAGVSIGENCMIGDRCTLHAGVQIMDNCRIGDDCELFPNVTLYRDTQVGQRVLIHAGAVLGAYGFGYRLRNGRHVRTAQLGWVELGDDVEIGAATTIDRGSYGKTSIGSGTKIDNQVQIGHNCHIGKNNLICAQVGIAGSTSTGDNVVLAGQVGIADHLTIADNVTVGAQSGVIGNLEQGALVLGSPAAPRRQRMLEWAFIAKLPDMRRELKMLQEKIESLTQQLESTAATKPIDFRRTA